MNHVYFLYINILWNNGCLQNKNINDAFIENINERINSESEYIDKNNSYIKYCSILVGKKYAVCELTFEIYIKKEIPRIETILALHLPIPQIGTKYFILKSSNYDDMLVYLSTDGHLVASNYSGKSLPIGIYRGNIRYTQIN